MLVCCFWLLEFIQVWILLFESFQNSLKLFPSPYPISFFFQPTTSSQPSLSSSRGLLFPRAAAQQPARAVSRCSPFRVAAQLAFRPKTSPARFPPPAPRHCRWPRGPTRHPLRLAVFKPDSAESRAASARVRLRHDSCAWPACQGIIPGYLNRLPPLEFATRAAAFAYPCAAGNPSRCRRRFPASASASSSGSRLGAAPGGELHARAACHQVRALKEPGDLTGVHDPHRRVDRPPRRISAAAAASRCFAGLRASRRCNPRSKPCTKTLV
jgi:hypothetical protein